MVLCFLNRSRTNLALYSNDLSNAAWSNSYSTITSNAAISPDGTTNANKVVETTDTGLHRAGQGAIAVTSGQVYTFSFYAKAAERNELELQRINTSGTVFNSISVTTADLILGTLSVGLNVTSSSINSVGDGWYRISLSLTAIATGSGGLNIGMQKDGNVSYLGDGTSGVYIYGFQAEQGSYATSYIPTQGAISTRAAEVCSGAGNATVFEDVNASGVLYTEMSALANEGGVRAVSLNNGTTSNRISIRYNSTSNQIQYQYTLGSVVQASITYNVTDVTANHKIAIRWAVNDFELFIDGVSRGTDVSGNVMSSGTLTTLDINGSSVYDYMYAKIKGVQVLSYQSDAEMIALTSL
jgi:hypothetical protein